MQFSDPLVFIPEKNGFLCDIKRMPGIIGKLLKSREEKLTQVKVQAGNLSHNCPRE